MTAIEWTDETWNPVTGCDRVSPGCAHCYALELALRLREMGVKRYVDARDGGRTSGPAFGVTLHPDVLELPLRWRRSRRVFVNSMSDLFHDEVPEAFIAEVFAIMALSSQHIFQVLTKRPERMREMLSSDRWNSLLARAFDKHGWVPTVVSFEPAVMPNVWLGVSIENRRFVGRADLLRETPAAVRFISAEPLLGPLVWDAGDGLGHQTPTGYVWNDYTGPQLDLTGIDWLIVGGESGPQHRPMREEWVRDLRDACTDYRPCPHCETWPKPSSVRDGWCLICHRRLRPAFFFKQWGGRTPKAGGRELDGRTWDEFPVAATAIAA
jgi:protein gp37